MCAKFKLDFKLQNETESYTRNNFFSAQIHRERLS